MQSSEKQNYFAIPQLSILWGLNDRYDKVEWIILMMTMVRWNDLMTYDSNQSRIICLWVITLSLNNAQKRILNSLFSIEISLDLHIIEKSKIPNHEMSNKFWIEIVKQKISLKCMNDRIVVVV